MKIPIKEIYYDNETKRPVIVTDGNIELKLFHPAWCNVLHPMWMKWLTQAEADELKEKNDLEYSKRPWWKKI